MGAAEGSREEAVNVAQETRKTRAERFAGCYSSSGNCWRRFQFGLPAIPRSDDEASRVQLAPHFLASWLNQVERFFSKITTQRVRRGTFDSVRALEAAIENYLSHHNEKPKPFVWTATADAILDKIKRFCERTSETRH